MPAKSKSTEQQESIRQICLLADEIAPAPKPLRRVLARDVKLLSKLLSGTTTRDRRELSRLVDAANRLLVVMRRRIQLPDGNLAMLALHEDKRGHAYVRFRVTTGAKAGTRGRLGGSPITLSPYAPRQKSCEQGANRRSRTSKASTVLATSVGFSISMD